MEFQYKKVLIWGYGVSGRAVEKVLIDIGVEYTILDEGNRLTGGGFVSKLTKKNISNFDLIVLSPGVNYHRKEIEYAKSIGVEILSEVEFGNLFLSPKTKVVAVTGTNGKTTTVNLIYNLLKIAGKKVAEVGNIGKPFSEIYKKNLDYVVVELSSFQLEESKHFRADISILLNIAPDHIDRHGSFENYLNAKLNIFKNQQKTDYAIINIDDEYIKNIKGINAKKISYSMESNKTKVSCINGVVYKQKKQVLDLNEFNISSIFYQDVLSVYIVGEILDLDIIYLRNLLSEYKFLSHRCEYVTNIGNIKFYDDSKATNIHAVEKCINSLKTNDNLLLLGGLDKGLNFKKFISNLDSSVKKIIAFGKARNKIYKCRKLNKNIEFYKCKNLASAMGEIENYFENINCVVLSPACASFDEFMSYGDRGDFFKKEVLILRDKYEKNKIKES